MAEKMKPVEQLVKVTTDAQGKKHYKTIGNIYPSKFADGAKLVSDGLFDALASDGEKFEIFTARDPLAGMSKEVVDRVEALTKAICGDVPPVHKAFVSWFDIHTQIFKQRGYTGEGRTSK